MCGLAAIFNYSTAAPPVDQAGLICIREAMLKRGPDGMGVWVSEDRRSGLAHRRLAIIDLSDTGAQPMATADGSVRIVFNGEIYNYLELRQDLKARGYQFYSNSDTEVLLNLYIEYGQDLVHHLRGMYAFVIWDTRKSGLLLARDPFGIKPLYYADDGRTIRVASQVKALLQSDHIDTSLEPAGHVGFYLWGNVPEPYTLYRGIKAIPSGTTLWVDTTGHKEIRRFFNITNELARASEAPLSVSREEMRECLRAALIDSVHHHLIADVPVGVFLSAGLDSATVTALACREVDGLHAITLGFEEYRNTERDEVLHAKLIAQHYSTHHKIRRVTRQEFQAERTRLLAAMDQPSTDGVNTYFVSKAASEVGLKVVLSGLGGDELFGGYPSFKQIPRMTMLCRPFHYMPRLGRGFCYLSAPVLKHFTSPKYAGLLEYGGTYGGAYLLRRGMFMPWELPDVMDGDVARQGWSELKTISQLERTACGIDNVRLKVTALETAWYMRNQLLRDTDWSSMAHSLEVRVPLVDIYLQSTVARLLASRYPPGKLDMASVPEQTLPEDILKRRKTGFSIPVGEWLLAASDAPPRDRGLRAWARFLLPQEVKAVPAET